MAGAYYDIPILYRDYTEYDDEKRKPKDGSDYLIELQNPFSTSYKVVMKKGFDQYNDCYFHNAAEYFSEINANTRNFKIKESARTLLKISKAMAYCSKYSFSDALEQLKKIDRIDLNEKLIDLEECQKWIDMLEVLKENMNYLGSGIEEKVLTALSNRKFIEYFLSIIMMYSSIDAEKHHDMDLSVLRLYRAIELIEQHLLALHGVNTSSVSIEDDEIRKRYIEQTEKIEKVLNEKGYVRKDIPNKLTLVNGFMLLRALRDEQSSKIDIPSLIRAINVRNTSPYEHGFVPVNTKNYWRMRNETEKILKQVFKDEVTELKPLILRKSC